jgi:multidrug resistance efflux pump
MKWLREGTALVPAQSATGNWIKVTQRPSVRIELKPEELLRDADDLVRSISATNAGDPSLAAARSH